MLRPRDGLPSAIELADRISIGHSASDDAVMVRGPPCTVCLAPSDVVYGGTNLCHVCAEVISINVVLPSVAAHLVTSGAPADHISRRVRDAASDPAYPAGEWLCGECGTWSDHQIRECSGCGARDRRLICPSCQQDAGIVEFCTSANDARPLRHDVWSCECGTAGLGGKQCLCCHKERTWFCSRCSMANPDSQKTCDACGGTERVASLSDFNVNATAGSLGSASTAATDRHRAEKQKSGRTRLLRRIHAMGGNVVEAADDGNCLFEALSFQTFRTRCLHNVVRKLLVKAIGGDQRGRFAEIMGQDGVAEYVARMSQDRTWGDEYILLAAAATLPATVHLVTSAEGKWKHTFSPPTGTSVAVTAVLAYEVDTHYFSIVFPPEADGDVLVDIAELASAINGLLRCRRAAATRHLSRFALPKRPSHERLTCPRETTTPTVAVVVLSGHGRCLRALTDNAAFCHAGSLWYRYPAAIPNGIVGCRAFRLQCALTGRFLQYEGQGGPHVALRAPTPLMNAVLVETHQGAVGFAFESRVLFIQEGTSSWDTEPLRVGPRAGPSIQFERIHGGHQQLCVVCNGWYDPDGATWGDCRHKSQVQANFV